MKIGSYWPGNDAYGLSRRGSSIVLLDPRTGRIDAVVEAAAGNALRTAAADALAVETLARTDAATLAILGTGHQAYYEATAVARVRPIETILVGGRDPERAAALADRLRSRLTITVEAVPVRSAVERADVIATATTAREPLFDADWVQEGTHISAMGTDGPGKQELPVELFDRARLFCDVTEQSRTIGELKHAPTHQPIRPLGAVLRGEAPGRTTAEEIPVFDSSGFALQGLALARALLRTAATR